MQKVHRLSKKQIWATYQLLEESTFKGTHTNWGTIYQYQHRINQLRTRLGAFKLNETEQQILDAQAPIVKQIKKYINRAALSLKKNELDTARRLVLHAQQQSDGLIEELEAWLQRHANELQERNRYKAQADFDETRYQIFVMDTMVLLMCLGIMGVIVYRIMHRENLIQHKVISLEAENEHLENQVASKTVDLLTARDQALVADKSKHRFLANMSHELRTPLNAIIGYSEMLRDDVQNQTYEEVSEYLDHIHDSSLNLLNLINAVLDVAQLESGSLKTRIETFRIRQMLDMLMQTAKPLMIKNRNQFSLRYLANTENMFSDCLRVRQILMNLLSNAAKFTHQGRIILEVSQKKQKDGVWILFKVSDTGVGLSEKQKKHLFKPFNQVDNSSTRGYGGAGLGLVISLRFCQLLGGHITIHSISGQGSIFTVRLPQKILPQQERWEAALSGDN